MVEFVFEVQDIQSRLQGNFMRFDYFEELGLSENRRFCREK